MGEEEKNTLTKLLVGIEIGTISVEGRYPLGSSLKLFTNPSLYLSRYKYYPLEVRYGYYYLH